MTKRYFAITIETAGDLDVHGIADALDHEFDLKSTDAAVLIEQGEGVAGSISLGDCDV